MPKANRKTGKPGRPTGSNKGPIQNFRLSKDAAIALVELQRKWGWSKVATVERAIHFAHTHPSFSPLALRPAEATQ